MNPSGVLMCEPSAFDVIDRKNPFMDPAVAVDRDRARTQWESVREAFEESGLSVDTIDPLAECEDMVFCANPAFTGTNARGERVAIASRMRHESRRREVEPQTEKLRRLGFAVEEIPPEIAFEGGGDALWHLGERRIWLGIGPRSGNAVIPHLERAFEVEVIPLRLSTERFYHLDTALSILDATTALVYRPALDPASYAELERHFTRLIDVSDEDAMVMAVNAARAGGTTVVIERAATATIAALRDLGYTVAGVDTSEFRKSGGSVYCMKQYLF